MLTRKAFWLAVFTGFRARSWSVIPPGESASAWRRGQSLNNQCPVCGTMAEPYVMANAGHLIPCSHPKPGQACVAPVPGKPPASRTIRCRRCNVRFDQDGI